MMSKQPAPFDPGDTEQLLREMERKTRMLAFRWLLEGDIQTYLMEIEMLIAKLLDMYNGET